jgi:hypothetical protein
MQSPAAAIRPDSVIQQISHSRLETSGVVVSERCRSNEDRPGQCRPAPARAYVASDESQREDETGTIVELASGATSGVESGVDRPPRSLELEDATPTVFETRDSSPATVDPEKDSDGSTGEMTLFAANGSGS